MLDVEEVLLVRKVVACEVEAKLVMVVQLTVVKVLGLLVQVMEEMFREWVEVQIWWN